jgi:alkanesulfonate monooxygenase SsuD/methylene tetrahydromethanopterin reductase-like flavin-dependent oxidoreductase (luciferase family)
VPGYPVAVEAKHHQHARVRYSINIPNFGDFADARNVARVAVAAEEAGWDGLFVWDHVVHDKRARAGQPFGDPWLLLTAAALATTRIRLGTLVTPVARRRPEQLARQVATLDGLSGGRVIFGAGLGGPIGDEFGSFGEPTDPVLLAARLDEGLDLLARYWTGEPVSHNGIHYRVDDVTLLPATVQQPRPPIWVGGFWPARPPMRRAARWDGAVPLFETARHGQIPPVDLARDLISYLRRQRGDGPFEIVLGGQTSSHEQVAPLAELGATWWDERFPMSGDDFYRLTPVMRRIEQGPPAA